MPPSSLLPEMPSDPWRPPSGSERTEHSESTERTEHTELSGRSLDQPHPSRLDPEHPRRDEILSAHREAMLEGRPGYLDPETGLFVLTAAELAGREECCDSGCRHCPYVS